MTEETREAAASPSGTEEATRAAVDAALNFLSYRQRTEHEVRRKLVDRGFGEETIEAAMTRLEDVGLVDDVAFIGAYVRDRIAHRPMGMRRMTQELRVKGITRDAAIPIIEEALREEGTDERSMARRVAEKKCPSLLARAEDRQVQRRRLREYLLRRGFSSRVIQEVVDEMLPRG